MRTIRPDPFRTTFWLCYGMIICLTAACASVSSQPPTGQAIPPTPTIAPFFQDTATQTSTPRVTAIAAPVTTSTPIPFVQAPTRVADQIAAILLYDDALNSNWSAERSDHVKYDVASTAFAYSGKKAIAVTPTNDFGRIYLTVRKDAQKVYPRDRILGIRFWLSGGENTIGTSDLAVTVTGSNQYTYWVTDDTSVTIDSPVTAVSPLFPETRLYYLHINRSIPPNTWAEVILWLDDLIDEPLYTNVTGMYIKNDQGFLNTYYVDDIQLLVQPET